MKFIPKDRYVMVYPDTDTLVMVNINKFLDRVKKDDPDFYVGTDTKVASSQERIKKSMDYITNYSNDSRMLHPKTGQRWDYEVMFEPTEASIYDGKIGIRNGRHRMVALKNLGYTHAFIEVPQDQKNLFSSLA
jgi:hypothetical protein